MKARIPLDVEQIKLLNAMYEEIVQFHLAREYGAISFTTEMQMDYAPYSRAIEYMRMLDEYEHQHTGAKARRAGYLFTPEENNELKSKLDGAVNKYRQIIEQRRKSAKIRYPQFEYIEPERPLWKKILDIL